MSGFEPLSSKDVVSIATTFTLGLNRPTFRVEELVQHLVAGASKVPGDRQWSGEGAVAEVLTANQGWRKGKVRISIEFCPDEPTETDPLEQIRAVELPENQQISTDAP